MRPVEVIETRDLIGAYLEKNFDRLRAHLVVGSEGLKYGRNPSKAYLDMAARALKYATTLAEPYLLGGVGHDLVVAGTERFPEGAVLNASLFPTMSGFVQLEQPITKVTEDGFTVDVRAMSWVTVGTSEPDGPPVGACFHIFATVNPRDYRKLPQFDHWPPFPWQEVFIRFGSGVSAKDSDALGNWVVSFCIAFLSFVQQKILIATKHRLRRSEARRVSRRPEDAPEVRVVTLRAAVRPRRDDDGEGNVEWRFRWLVRGHWRNQWYPKAEEHRLIWVMPYVKGPEGKPLRSPSDRVFAVVR